jgi:methylmalonyl-CoA mutase cobalamin-binding domain/chain
LNKEDQAGQGKIAIGVVEGDTHDIGKNLVRIMLETGGFDVHDLGRDVPLDKFVEYARNHDVNIICMSSLMTTTMPGMEEVIQKLKEAGLRGKVKVMVGGAPVSPAFAKKIGADGYSRNAVEAVKLAHELLKTAQAVAV